MNAELDRIERMDAVSDDAFTPTLVYLYKYAPEKHSSDDLMRMRRLIWRHGRTHKTELHLNGVEAELNRRSSGRNFWTSLIVSVAALIVAIIALFR